MKKTKKKTQDTLVLPPRQAPHWAGVRQWRPPADAAGTNLNSNILLTN